MRSKFAVLLLLSFSALLRADEPAPKTLGAAATQDLARSWLMAPGSHPFHLKLEIRDVQNPASDQHAVIEEFWASPTEWKRVVTAPNLSYTVTMKDSTRMVEASGDYLPLWLRGFITALEDPIPAAVRASQAELIQNADAAGNHPPPCAALKIAFGDTPETSAKVCFFYNYRLRTIDMPEYQMEFHEYAGFGGREIPQLYLSLQNNSLLVGKVKILENLSKMADLAPGPNAQNEDPFNSVMVGSTAVKRLAKEPITMAWPKVPAGKTTGRVIALVSNDNTGKVREAWVLESDNFFLNDEVSRQLIGMKWTPASAKNRPIQITSLVELPFTTSSSDSEAKTLQAQSLPSTLTLGRALSQPRPEYPLQAKMLRIGGTVYLSVVIDKAGSIAKLGVIESPSPLLSHAAEQAVVNWKYQPYLIDGVPIEVETMITVNFDPR